LIRKEKKIRKVRTQVKNWGNWESGVTGTGGQLRKGEKKKRSGEHKRVNPTKERKLPKKDRTLKLKVKTVTRTGTITRRNRGGEFVVHGTEKWKVAH